MLRCWISAAHRRTPALTCAAAASRVIPLVSLSRTYITGSMASESVPARKEGEEDASASASASAQMNGAAPSSPTSSEPGAKKVKHEHVPANSKTASAAAASSSSNITAAAAAYAKAQASRLKAKRRTYTASVEKKGVPDPITHDILELLGSARVRALEDAGLEWEDRFKEGEEVAEVRIERLSAHGDGLGVVRREAREEGGHEDTWVMAVPRALPGETVRVKVTENDRMFTRATIVDHVGHARSPQRRDDLVRCKYFMNCSGCQYQMLDYDEQLRIKQGVVEKAFKLYSGLAPERIPAVLPTMPSPAQYEYRTKLTPHFELPPIVRQIMKPKRRRGGGGLSEGAKAKIQAQAAGLDLSPEDLAKVDEQLRIGFHRAGKGSVIDIEECTIATATLNKAMAMERKRVKDSIFSYQNGATLLLRDSLLNFSPELPDLAPADGLAGSEVELADGSTCITVTNHKKVVLERVNETKFESPAGTFFQNNRSILPDLIGYVRDEVNQHWVSRSELSVDEGGKKKKERFLVDAYCGSGLFSLCLADAFDQVSGVEISADSIRFAERNAVLNGLSKDKVRFLTGKAEDIFGTIQYPPERTTLIIDPPRKGCDEAFINQLVALGPALIVYVSCNVHTQARDVGQILTKDPSYTINSVRGADLFPQTHHVEGVCVLKKEIPAVKEKESSSS
ncbi:tRNA(m5U54)methyltransferase [Tilletia horrida]|uniref:tRNA(M5U54)methyltransferase n=1 Tax=Tilletia horrida TaxID=155126 RepID=A0AAN6G8H5_9BASI|nr:tRNA(m5U54)methyltransferase [Tilletia horrida]